MKKTIAILLVLCLTLCSAAAIGEAATDATSFVITLTANPTTGYAWQYTLSAEGVAAVEETFLTQADAKALAGAETTDALLTGEGGYSVFTVKGVQPGDVTIALTYSQSWEKDEEPEAKVAYTLHVGDDLSVVCVASAVGVDD